MWLATRIGSEARGGIRDFDHDLAVGAVRNVILAGAALYAALVLASEAVSGGRTRGEVWLLLPLVAGATALSYTLAPKRLLTAESVWLGGLWATIVLGSWLSRQPYVLLCLAWLPLLASVLVGSLAGLAVELALILAVVWLGHPSMLGPWPPALTYAIVGTGAGGIVLGWACSRTLIEAARFSMSYCADVVRDAEEARAQRLELKQVQEDLMQANQELARLSERLRSMYQIAEQARRAKEEFVCNVRAKLRTPLNMIIGFSEMIPKLSQVYGTKLPPALLSDIAAIRRNSQHLSQLIDDVLDLSQIESGRMALSKEWVSVGEIIEEASTAVRALFDSKGLYLESEIGADLPEVFCDSTRIRQVILNLLSNAGRFTESGGVRVQAWREGREVIISVRDTGPGIPQQDQERIFQPFQQLDSSIRRRHGGSGLGLSISRHLVELHGGRMWLESEVGVGTTFFLSLPVETPVPVAVAGADEARRWFSPYGEWEFRQRTRPFKAPAPSVPPRFVLLEEGRTARSLLSRHLQGAEIVTVRTMEEAVAELRRSPARALIINAPPSAGRWPGDDGYADIPYGTPTLRCWLPGEDEAARRLGVVSYLVKPITGDALLSAIEALGEGVDNVLVVDDEPEALQLFARMLALAPRGYRVLQAPSGERALELLRERRPDCMLLDLAMPGMDGYQVLVEKSRDESIRSIPVIVISARDPTGEAIVSQALTVTRSGGLSVRDLLTCIETLSEMLAPMPRPAGRAQPGTPPA